jgi:hypothetical protein
MLVYPVQSLFAAALLLTLAFSGSDVATPRAAQTGNDAIVQTACDLGDSSHFAASDVSVAAPSPCNTGSHQ